ncbi:MAG: HlyC/CorC family transporter [Fibrobacteres bacterium]|nr:HlyC/CorC family transporter [Fibrobacterota bacterium]
MITELLIIGAILFVLILLNAMFAATEMALATARRSRLQNKVDEGHRGAQLALQLQEDPNRFLSTTQIGITLVGTLAAVLTGDRLEEPLIQVYEPWMGEWARWGVMATVVAGVSFLQLVIGELVPKRVGIQYADVLAAALGRPMMFLSMLARPLVWVLSGCTNAILWALRLHRAPEETVTQEDIRHMVRESAEHGEIQEQEEDLIHSVFDMGEKLVRQLRTPRTTVVGVDLDLDLDEQLPALMESGYSRFPAYRGNLDHIEGVVIAKDIFRACLASDTRPSLEGLVRELLLVPENTRAMALLQLMKKKHQHLAVVVNEHGIFEGVVTLEDLVEEIVGDIQDETDEETDPDIVATGGGRWLISGKTPVEKFKEAVEISSLPQESEGHYDTIAGLVLALMGRIPSTGEEITAAGWVYRVVDMDGLRIDKVEVSKLDRDSASDAKG